MKQDLLDEAIATLITVQDWLRFGATLFEEADLFFGHGADNAWSEAAQLILPVLHLSPDYLPDVLSCRLLPTEKKQVADFFAQRVTKKIPAAYITEQAWFAGLRFYVNSHVLVPRSPIAELIEQHFSPWLDSQEVLSIADIGTGSGCIACACAHYFPDATVDAIDISADALSVAQKNIAQHGLEDRVQAIQSDLFAKVDSAKKYDLIVSNPPYVDQRGMDALPVEFLAEPRLGLAAGQDGLDIVIPLLHQAAERLTENGILIVEVGFSQPALEAKFPDVPFLWLDFQRGGQGVFLLTAEQLKSHFFLP